MNHRHIVRTALRQILAEKWQSFDGITDQIERAGNLVKELGGLHAAEISEFDRARISDLIETQVGMGIARGDFDFVFRTPPPVKVPEFQVASLALAPGDVMVLKYAGRISDDIKAKLEAIARQAFDAPRKILVIDETIELWKITEDKT